MVSKFLSAAAMALAAACPGAVAAGAAEPPYPRGSVRCRATAPG